MKKVFALDKSIKKFPFALFIAGVIIAAAQLITRQNFVAVLSVGYCCIMSAVIVLSVLIKKKVYI